ncbi:MAG: hypothetical protein WCF57_02025 [Pyrinomonadaceae bacterium]
MTLDFTMAIREITQETMRDYYRGRSDTSEHQWEFAERQNRLLLALLSNEDVLTKFLVYLITEEALTCIDSEVDNVFEVKESEDILEPVYSGMDQGDAEFFQGAKEGGIFADGTEMLEESFGVKCTRATVTELRMLAEGDVRKVE